MDESPNPIQTSPPVTPQSNNYFRQLFSGRINRGTYLLGILFWWIVLAIFSGALESAKGRFPIGVDLVMIIISIVAITCELSLIVKRFHDIGHAGIESILLFVPFINLYFFLLLILKSGKQKENIYGPIPQTNLKVIIGR